MDSYEMPSYSPSFSEVRKLKEQAVSAEQKCAELERRVAELERRLRGMAMAYKD